MHPKLLEPKSPSTHKALQYLNIRPRVSFQHKRKEWLHGIIADIDKPRITISREEKMFPMRQARFRPLFGTISLYLEINQNSDIEDAGILEKHVTDQNLQTRKRTSHRQLSPATSP